MARPFLTRGGCAGPDDAPRLGHGLVYAAHVGLWPQGHEHGIGERHIGGEVVHAPKLLRPRRQRSGGTVLDRPGPESYGRSVPTLGRSPAFPQKTQNCCWIFPLSRLYFPQGTVSFRLLSRRMCHPAFRIWNAPFLSKNRQTRTRLLRSTRIEWLDREGSVPGPAEGGTGRGNGSFRHVDDRNTGTDAPAGASECHPDHRPGKMV